MKLAAILALLVINSFAYSQQRRWDKAELSKYFTLKVNERSYKIKGKDTLIVSSYPAILTSDTSEVIGKTLFHQKRRFEYLLQNRTFFKNGFQKLYPDTNKIISLYLDTLARNSIFLAYLDATVKPFTAKKNNGKVAFTQDELMTVASRFFYCDAVMPDTSIYWHVCIGLNGLKEAQWKKDYTLLEAFCFETIFHYLKDPAQATYMDNFISNTTLLKNKYIGENNSTNGLLEYVRKNAFDLMYADPILKERLLTYYKANEHNLGFKIIKSTE